VAPTAAAPTAAPAAAAAAAANIAHVAALGLGTALPVPWLASAEAMGNAPPLPALALAPALPEAAAIPPNASWPTDLCALFGAHAAPAAAPLAPGAMEATAPLPTAPPAVEALNLEEVPCFTPPTVCAAALSGSACVSPFELETKRPKGPHDPPRPDFFAPHDLKGGLPAALALPVDWQSMPPVEDELAEYAAFVEQLLAE